MMKFKFVDTLEKDIATYLEEYNQKHWKRKNHPEEEAALLRGEPGWTWSERHAHQNNLISRINECRERLNRVEERDALLIDEVDEQRVRIDQLDLVMQNLSESKFYKKWTPVKIISGVDLNHLLYINRAVMGCSVEFLIHEAKEWAESGGFENKAEAETAFTLRLLIDEMGMTRDSAARQLKDRGDLFFKNRKTEGSRKNKYQELQEKYRDFYPEKVPRGAGGAGKIK